MSEKKEERQTITVKILDRKEYEKQSYFYVELAEPIWKRRGWTEEEDELEPLKSKDDEERRIAEMGRPTLGEHVKLEVIIEESYEFKSTVDKLIKKTNLALLVKTNSWRDQFIEAITVSAVSWLPVKGSVVKQSECMLKHVKESTVDKLIKKTNLALLVKTNSWRDQFIEAITVSAAEGEYLLVPPSPLWEDCWPLPPPPAEDEYLLVPPPPGAEEQGLPLLPVPPPEGVRWPEPQKGELPATKKGEEVWRPLSPAAVSLQEFLWPEPHRRELPDTKKAPQRGAAGYEEGGGRGTTCPRSNFAAGVDQHAVSRATTGRGEDEDDDECGEEKLPSCFDYVMHFLTVFWKVLFAVVPPTEYWNGWACFIVSICMIGLLTAFIGDLASHFGCTIGLKDSVTAVVFVALGTSVPALPLVSSCDIVVSCVGLKRLPETRSRVGVFFLFKKKKKIKMGKRQGQQRKRAGCFSCGEYGHCSTRCPHEEEEESEGEEWSRAAGELGSGWPFILPCWEEVVAAQARQSKTPHKRDRSCRRSVGEPEEEEQKQNWWCLDCGEGDHPTPRCPFRESEGAVPLPTHEPEEAELLPACKPEEVEPLPARKTEEAELLPARSPAETPATSPTPTVGGAGSDTSPTPAVGGAGSTTRGRRAAVPASATRGRRAAVPASATRGRRAAVPASATRGRQVAVLSAAPPEVAVLSAAPPEVAVLSAASPEVAVLSAAPPEVAVLSAASPEVAVLSAAPPEVVLLSPAPPEVAVLSAAPPEVAVLFAAPPEVAVLSAAPPEVAVLSAGSPEVPVLLSAAPPEIAVLSAAPSEVPVFLPAAPEGPVLVPVVPEGPVLVPVVPEGPALVPVVPEGPAPVVPVPAEGAKLVPMPLGAANLPGPADGYPGGTREGTIRTLGLWDTFASKVAATQDQYADASIGNVTGSNAVNVFLGIGVAWSIAAIYHNYQGRDFRVDPGTLAFSVTLFTIFAFICVGVLMYRRRPEIGGELGGPRTPKILTSLLFVSLWLLYILFSSLEAYCHVKGF
ncbi:UNVERIFIED_CONTAM: hypothetical protein FKN15_045256 [Acipenser sinensis]